MLNYGTERHSAPRPAAGRDAVEANVLSPESFGRELEREVHRHARYLSGLGLACIAPGRDLPSQEALREAIATETRRTDTVTQLPDGSWVVLAVNAGDRDLEALVTRIASVAAEIAGESDAAPFVAAAASSGSRRLEAFELWAMLSEALTEARRSGSRLVFGTWSD